jgi:general secretion pathway protein H|tara:strand:+ start:110 stop:622 length:513 start_codon:yes stop_codon:yes gene_type:complete
MSLRRKGFTLLEVLVVLFIVSVMTGITVINLPGFAQTDGFDYESDRLKAVIGMLREDAIMQSNDYGLQIQRLDAGDNYGYEFYIYDAEYQDWQALTELPFSARSLPEEIALSLKVEGDDVQLQGEDAPPVLILSSGEVTPFTLLIAHRDNVALNRTLGSDGYSDVDWQEE